MGIWRRDAEGIEYFTIKTFTFASSHKKGLLLETHFPVFCGQDPVDVGVYMHIATTRDIKIAPFAEIFE